MRLLASGGDDASSNTPMRPFVQRPSDDPSETPLALCHVDGASRILPFYGENKRFRSNSPDNEDLNRHVVNASSSTTLLACKSGALGARRAENMF